MNTPTKIQINPNTRLGMGADADRSWQLAASAAVGWLAVGIVGGWWDITDDNGDGLQYLVFSIALLFSAALTVAAAWSSTKPSHRRTLRRCGLAIGIFAVLSAVVAWATLLWMTTIAISLAVFAGAAPRNMRPGLTTTAVGQILGIVVTIGAIEAEVGRQNSYGDYPVALDLGVLVAAAGSILGLALLVRAARASKSER